MVQKELLKYEYNNVTECGSNLASVYLIAVLMIHTQTELAEQPVSQVFVSKIGSRFCAIGIAAI